MKDEKYDISNLIEQVWCGVDESAIGQDEALDIQYILFLFKLEHGDECV